MSSNLRLLPWHLHSACRRLSRIKIYKPEIRSHTTAAASASPVNGKTDDCKWSKKAAVQTLEQLLSIRTLNALDVVSRNSCFRDVPTAILRNNYAFCVQNDITLGTMQKFPEILTVADADRKVTVIKKLPYDVNVTAVLMLLDLNVLMKFVFSELAGHKKKNGKIHVLSSGLKITPQKACECLAHKPFLVFMPTDKIETNIRLLLRYGIKAEDVCSDLWVLRYRDELIRNRLSTAQENNVESMKTWMVRAPHDAFQTYIRRRSDNRSVLGDSSFAEYLSERLQCSVAVANYLMTKQPALPNKSLKKLKELIDFLYSQGFEPQHICRVPKILVHSVETIRKRLKQLEQDGIKIDSLSMLTKSQNQFTQYYEALVKNKNKSKNKT